MSSKRWRWYPGERVAIRSKADSHGTVLEDHFMPPKSRVEVSLDDGQVVLCPFTSLRKERVDRGRRKPSRRRSTRVPTPTPQSPATD